jgi:rhodanese-related sulfurtransferase
MKLPALVFASLLFVAPSLQADDKTPLLDALDDYMTFADYGGSLILPEQIPAEEWKNTVVIDARDAGQYGKEHIPGAINVEWRQVVARRNEIPKDKLVVVYCNTGTLSAQAGLALRLLGWDNVRILQGGLVAWKAKGGFEAGKRSGQAVLE